MHVQNVYAVILKLLIYFFSNDFTQFYFFVLIAVNPPPFCVPIPIPYIPPGLVDMCVRLFDVSIIQQKLHVCMDMDTRIDMAPILVRTFNRFFF